MGSEAAISIFILRLVSLIASLISVFTVASSHLSLLDHRYGFKDFVTFRYLMAVAVMSLVYGVVQLPIGAYQTFKHTRLIPFHYEFYADQVMSVLLATASVAGIAVSRQEKHNFSGFGDTVDDYDDGTVDNIKKQCFKYLNKLLAGSVMLFLAWIFLAVASIISYHRNANHKNPTMQPPSTHNQTTTFDPSPKEFFDAQHTHLSVPTTDELDVKPSSDDVSSV